MRNLRVAELSYTSAEAILTMFKSDYSLPNKADFDKMAADPSIIPIELRVFDLIFPQVIFKGLSEGGGADKVTDDSIGVLIWNGTKWQPGSLLAGKDGWGYSGPDHTGPRARLVRFDA